MEEASSLATEDLRALLRTGDPRERLGAAWALGLRLGAAGTGTIASGARGELHPGVRRHLVVVVAGLGERQAVWAMASGDPAAEVRAVACQCLAMSSVPGDDTPWETLIDRLERDDSLPSSRLLSYVSLFREHRNCAPNLPLAQTDMGMRLHQPRQRAPHVVIVVDDHEALDRPRGLESPRDLVAPHQPATRLVAPQRGRDVDDLADEAVAAEEGLELRDGEAVVRGGRDDDLRARACEGGQF